MRILTSISAITVVTGSATVKRFSGTQKLNGAHDIERVGHELHESGTDRLSVSKPRTDQTELHEKVYRDKMEKALHDYVNSMMAKSRITSTSTDAELKSLYQRLLENLPLEFNADHLKKVFGDMIEHIRHPNDKPKGDHLGGDSDDESGSDDESIDSGSSDDSTDQIITIDDPVDETDTATKYDTTTI